MNSNQGMNPNSMSAEARAEFLKKEAEAARKGAHDMWVAGITIVGAFVLVFVLVALVIIIGHIQIF